MTPKHFVAFFFIFNAVTFDEPEEGEHYVCDLIGLSVFDEEGSKLGVLKEILQNGAADVYVVKGGRSFMFPGAEKRDIVRRYG